MLDNKNNFSHLMHVMKYQNLDNPVNIIYALIYLLPELIPDTGKMTLLMNQ